MSDVRWQMADGGMALKVSQVVLLVVLVAVFEGIVSSITTQLVQYYVLRNAIDSGLSSAPAKCPGT